MSLFARWVPKVGQRAHLWIEVGAATWTIPVVILDTEEDLGRIDCKIRPEGGRMGDTAWVSECKLTLREDAEVRP